MISIIIKKVIVVLTSVALILTLAPSLIMPQIAFAEKNGISFNCDSYEFTINEDSQYNTESIAVETEEGVETWESSNESVVEISYGGWNTVYFYVKHPGTSTITATGNDGSTAVCTVNVVTPDIVITEKNLNYSISDQHGSIEITSGYGLTFKSSNESVLRIDSDSYDSRCFFDLISPGHATITVKDIAGKSESVSVDISESEWSLEMSTIKCFLSDDSGEIRVNTEDWSNDFIGKSSNTKVVSVDNYYGYGIIGLTYNQVGTATITVRDKYGKKASCTVDVRPDTISFGKNATVKLNSYKLYSEYDDYVFDTKGDSFIASVKSANEKVVKAYRTGDSYDEGTGCYLKLVPVGVGTTTVMAKDQYGQSAIMSVTITQKFIDEYRYLEYLSSGYVTGYEENLEYGDTTLYCWCDISASVYTTIKGKKYTGRVGENGYFIIKGIPKLPAGTKITVVFQKGQAIYKSSATIQKKKGTNLPVSVKTKVLTYTGRALKPTVIVKHGKSSLKAGSDYTVSYSANKNVGRAKATVTFKKNYRGTRVVYFTINPKPTKVSNVSAEKKGFTVKWKKQATQTTGYQIQYSTNKSFKSGNKLVTISNIKTVSKKVTKLKAKQRYYVRVRTFKTVGKTKYYSGWSPSKTVITKK